MGFEDAAQLALRNLTSVPVLAFLLGAVATSMLRVDLRLPEPVYRVMSFYLLLAIGLKGGVALREAGLEGVLAPAAVAVALGLLVPVGAFHALGLLTRLGRTDRGAMAAHYGSTSLVTFTAAVALVSSIGLPAEGHLATLVVILEIPGIVVGLALARRRTAIQRAARRRTLVGSGAPVDDRRDEPDDADDAGGGPTPPRTDDAGADGWATAIREVLTGPSILLMAGGLVIGAAAGLRIARRLTFERFKQMVLVFTALASLNLLR